MEQNDLRLVDIFIHEDVKNPVLDITLYNRGNQVVLPTRAKIEVLDVGEFYDCDDDQARSFTPVTREYGVVLSPSLRGQERVVQISHLLRPEESDRFQLVISQRIDNPALVCVWYKLKVTIIYDEKAHNIISQPILLSIPPVNRNVYDIWGIGDASCIAQNKATLSRMASRTADRSPSVEAAIQFCQANIFDSEGDPPPFSSSLSSNNTPTSQPATPSIDDPIEIFFSHVQEDERLVKKLDEQLAALKNRKLITNWHKRKIVPGKNFNEEVRKHLDSAHIILLLVSPSFLNSPDIAWEVAYAMTRNETQKVIVIPVLLCPTVGWQSAPFGNLLAIPRNGKAITDWTNQNAAFAQVAEEIVEIVKMLKKQKDI